MTDNQYNPKLKRLTTKEVEQLKKEGYEIEDISSKIKTLYILIVITLGSSMVGKSSLINT